MSEGNMKGLDNISIRDIKAKKRIVYESIR